MKSAVQCVLQFAASYSFIGFCAALLWGTGPVKASEDTWAAKPSLTWAQVVADPESYVGQTHVFIGRLAYLGWYPRKTPEFSDYDPRDTVFGNHGAQAKVDISNWHAKMAKSPQGRERARELAKAGGQGVITIYAVRARVMLLPDTFEPYMVLVDIKDTLAPSSGDSRPSYPAHADQRPREGRPSRSIAAASSASSATPTASTPWTRAAQSVPLAKHFRQQTASVNAPKDAAFTTLKQALIHLKEQIANEDATVGIVSTRTKKHGFLGTPRQIIAAVESSTEGESLISLKIIWSIGQEPVRDRRFVAKNDLEIIDSISQFFLNAGMRFTVK